MLLLTVFCFKVDAVVNADSPEVRRLLRWQKLCAYCDRLREELLAKVSGWQPFMGEPINGRGTMTYYGEREVFLSFEAGNKWLREKFDRDFPPPELFER